MRYTGEFILFYDTKSKYGFLSNFYPLASPLKVDGELWLTTEHYFQAMKFRGNNASPRHIEYSNLIKLADSPAKVKMLGSQRKNLRFGKSWVLNKKIDRRIVNDLVDKYSDLKIRPDWDKVKIQVMTKVLIEKFSLPGLKDKLISVPDNAILVEHTSRDSVWADGGDGGTGTRGKNYLGKILTALSYVLKYRNCDKMPPEMKKKIRVKE